MFLKSRLRILRMVICTTCIFIQVLHAQEKVIPADSLGIITTTRLIQHVQALAHDSMKGRMTGAEGAYKSADYIASIMQQIGLDTLPGNNGFYQHWDYEGKQVANMVAYLPSQYANDSIIVFSSHYDHVGDYNDRRNAYPFGYANKFEKDDKIFNGANDNASGTAAVLALAAYYKKNQHNIRYSLLFVNFCGEEEGLFGSNYFVNKPSIFLPQIIIRNINLEMLGRPGYNEPFITEGQYSFGFRVLMNATIMQQTGVKNYFNADSYTEENLFYRSDNYSFVQLKIPANTIMATNPQDAYYHHVNDEWETLNYNKMTEIIMAVVIGCGVFMYN